MKAVVLNRQRIAWMRRRNNLKPDTTLAFRIEVANEH